MNSFYQMINYLSGLFWDNKKKIVLDDKKKLLFKKLFYMIHMNLYGCFFSDRECDWIYPSYSFIKYDSTFLFSLRYDNGYLWIKIDKIIGLIEYLTEKEILWLNQLKEKDFILVYTGKERRNQCGSEYKSEQNSVQMEFKKWIGTLNLGYFELFDRINDNFLELIQFFSAKMPEWKDVRKNMLEIGILEKLKLYQSEENKDYAKDEICATYYIQGMNDFDWKNTYEYYDWQNLRKINLYKQKMLSLQIYELFNQIRQEESENNQNLDLFAKSLMTLLYD
jgi:hypothetical protein